MSEEADVEETRVIEPKFSSDPFKINKLSLAIGTLPLAVLSLIMVFNSELLIGEHLPEAKPIFYPAVAVVFVSTSTERRALELEADVTAARLVELAAEKDALISGLATRAGRDVTRGDSLCRLRYTDDGQTDVLFSPLDGVVSTVNGTRGTLLKAGQPCLTIIDPRAMIATASMQRHYAQTIKPGDLVAATTNGTREDSAVGVIYPKDRLNPTSDYNLEVELSEAFAGLNGKTTSIALETDQILPTLVPARALMLEKDIGMVVRVVTGSGPTGTLETLPITLVASAREGFYVHGLPTEARLVIRNENTDLPEDGTVVRIGQVG